MVRLKPLLITGLIIVIGVVAVFCLLPNEEKRVRKQFDLLAQYVAKEPNEDLLSAANRAKNIGRLFADPCEFKAEGDSFYSLTGKYSREELISYAFRGRSYFSSLSLKFHDLKIEFPEREAAKVRVTATLSGRSASGESVDEAREFLSVLQKIEKKWLFSQFEVVEVLKR
jgi:hypothetical protein